MLEFQQEATPRSYPKAYPKGSVYIWSIYRYYLVKVMLMYPFFPSSREPDSCIAAFSRSVDRASRSLWPNKQFGDSPNVAVSITDSKSSSSARKATKMKVGAARKK